MYRTKNAFTLIELLVVIAIIAILAAILFPVFAQAKESAKQASSTSNVKQVNLANQMYMADYDDKMPIAWSWTNPTPTGNIFPSFHEVIFPYMKSEQILLHSSASKNAATYGQGGCTNAAPLNCQVIATYVWPSFFTWVRWGAFGGLGALGNVAFGFPAPQESQSAGIVSGNHSLCGSFPGNQECRGLDTVEAPADVYWLIGGYMSSNRVTTGPAASFKFGSASGMGFGANGWSLTAPYPTSMNYHRSGFIAGRGEGSAKYIRAQAMYTDKGAGLATSPINRYCQIVTQ